MDDSTHPTELALQDRLLDDEQDWENLSSEDAAAYFGKITGQPQAPAISKKSTFEWIVSRLCQSVNGIEVLLANLDHPALKPLGVESMICVKAFLVWHTKYQNDQAHTSPQTAHSDHQLLLEQLIEQSLPLASERVLARACLVDLPKADFSAKILNRIVHSKNIFQHVGNVEEQTVMAFLASFVSFHDPNDPHHQQWLALSKNSVPMYCAVWRSLVQQPDPKWPKVVIPLLNEDDFLTFLSYRPMRLKASTPLERERILSLLWGMMNDKQQEQFFHPAFEDCPEARAKRERFELRLRVQTCRIEENEGECSEHLRKKKL